jgi:hypothetical protein
MNSGCHVFSANVFVICFRWFDSPQKKASDKRRKRTLIQTPAQLPAKSRPETFECLQFGRKSATIRAFVTLKSAAARSTST